MINFQDAILYLEQVGVADVLLPFLLVFTLVFAIMQKTELFGKDKKNVHIIVALVMGLAVVIPHVTGMYSNQADVVDIINSALPNISVGIIAVVMLLLLLGLWGGTNFAESKATGWMIFLAFIFVVFVFVRAAGYLQSLPSWLYFLDDPSTQALIVVVIVFFVIVGYITKEPSEVAKSGSFFDEIRKLVKK
jgi:Kef-type K+ transport system membrane component KefB